MKWFRSWPTKATREARWVLSLLMAIGVVVTGCAAAPQQPKPRQYECGPVGDKGAVLLPVPSSDGAVVNVRLHGRRIAATYLTSGLTELWHFEDGLYLEVEPWASGFTALYWDFRGAAPNEKRKPTSVFFCEWS